MAGIPSGSAPTPPGEPVGIDTRADGTIVGGGMSAFAGRTEGNVRNTLRGNVAGNQPLQQVGEAIYDGLRTGIALPLALIEALVQRLFGVNLTFPGMEDALGRIKKVPILGDLVEVISGIEDGDLNDLGTWFNNNIIGGIQNIVSTIVEALTGLPSPGALLGDLFDGIQDLFNTANDAFGKAFDAAGDLGDLIQDLLTNPGSVLGQIPKAIIGGLDSALDTLTSGVGAAAGAAAGVINAMVNGFMGLFGVEWGVSDAQKAAELMAKQAADTASAVQLLQQQNDTAAQSGASVFLDFSNAPNASSLGGGWVQYYSGAGTNTWGINDGRVMQVPTEISGGRYCNAVYSEMVTDGDQQRISAVFSTAPQINRYGFQWDPHYSYGYNNIQGRCDAAGSNCVRVIFGDNKFWLGTLVNGSWTQWITGSHEFQVGAIYALECGTNAGMRSYRVSMNNRTIIQYNEVGTASKLGVGFRHGGMGAEWQSLYDSITSKYAIARAAQVAAFSVADSGLPPLIGSIGRVFRSASSNAFTSGQGIDRYPIPATTFDTIEYKSNDLTWEQSTGSWIVSKRGNYQVNAQMANELTNQGGVVGLMLNGVLKASGNGGVFSTINCTIHLMPGDRLQLGYRFWLDNSRIIGAVSGALTWFQITKTTEDVIENDSGDTNQFL